MSGIRSLLFLLFISLSVASTAGVSTDDLPAGTLWYLHADLEQMRNSASGQDLYRWADEEIFAEIQDELGIDVNKEANSITAFANPGNGTVIVIDGPVSESTQEKLLSLARLKAEVTEHKYKGLAYYFVGDGDDGGNGDHDSSGPLADLEAGAFVSFALKHKILITGNEKQMQDMLANKGKVAGGNSHKGALFVLTADRAFVQAGLKTDEIDGDGGWSSNIIRNTEQATLTIADLKGMVAIEVQLVSTDPKMAQSIGGIANGLLSLQAFSPELDPGIKSVLDNTKVKVTDNVLSISTVIAPEIIISVLNN